MTTTTTTTTTTIMVYLDDNAVAKTLYCIAVIIALYSAVEYKMSIRSYWFYYIRGQKTQFDPSYNIRYN